MKTFYIILSSFAFFFLFMFFSIRFVNAQPPYEVPVEGGLPACIEDLNLCTADLDACEARACLNIPGDGYPNPDYLGVSGHGPALSYTDNEDGTFTDNNTGLMWEKKLAVDSRGGNCEDIPANRSVRCVNNVYTWTDTGDIDYTNPDGTLFMVFLDKLNNTCDGAGFDACSADVDCMGLGNEVCGLGGYRDWRIPNIKELQSIVDYNAINPLRTGFTSIPSPTSNGPYWSATTNTHEGSDVAWGVNFGTGVIDFHNKAGNTVARAVRP